MKSETQKAVTQTAPAHRPQHRTPGPCLPTRVAATESRGKEAENQSFWKGIIIPGLLTGTWHVYTTYTLLEMKDGILGSKVTKGAEHSAISQTAAGNEQVIAEKELQTSSRAKVP